MRLLTTVFFAGLETYEGEHHPIGVTFVGRSSSDFVMTDADAAAGVPLYRWKILRFAVAASVRAARAGEARGRGHRPAHVLGRRDPARTERSPSRDWRARVSRAGPIRSSRSSPPGPGACPSGADASWSSNTSAAPFSPSPTTRSSPRTARSTARSRPSRGTAASRNTSFPITWTPCRSWFARSSRTGAAAF